MPYKLKKDHLTNWDAQQPNEKFNDDQDDSISERSSASSLDETSQLPKPMDKQLSPPIPRKEPRKLQYHYNKLPENGVPLATQVKQGQSEDRKRRKNLRKAPPGQGNLVPLPEIKSNEMSENYFPYSRYYKATNPDYIMRHRQTVDGQLIPYEYIDPSQYAPEPAAVATTTSSKKSRRHHRKSHHNSTLIQYNPDKNLYETVQKDFQPTYDQQRSVPKQYIPLKDANNGEYPSQFNTQIQSPRQQYEKSPINNNWNDHYIQSMTPRKSSHDSNTSKHHHSKKKYTILPEVNKNHHHHHHHSSPPSEEHHHHHSSSPSEEHHHHHHHHSPSQSQHHHSPSQSQHHHHHRHRHHHHHHSPTKEYVDSEFQVVDNSFKKSERTAYFQPTQNPFQPTPPAIYNQSSYLPPISPDDYYRPYPADYYRPHKIDYYSTQLFPKDRRDSLKPLKIYRADAQKNFYDRYLNNVITKQVS